MDVKKTKSISAAAKVVHEKKKNDQKKNTQVSSNSFL